MASDASTTRTGSSEGWGADALQRFTNHYVPQNLVVRQLEMGALLGFAQMSCCKICHSKEKCSVGKSKKSRNVKNKDEGLCAPCTEARKHLFSVCGKDSVEDAGVHKSTLKAQCRVLHLAAFPGSGKTMLLQKLEDYKRAYRSHERKSVEEKKKHAQIDLETSSLRDADHIEIMSCAAKSWSCVLQTLLQKIDIQAESHRGKLSAKLQGDKLRDAIVDKLEEYSGLIILDEIDTVLTMGSHIGYSHPTRKRSSSQSQAESCHNHFEFLISALSRFKSWTRVGVVLISNNVNIHPSAVIRPSIRTSVYTMLLRAYEKEEIQKIILERCAGEAIFEESALAYVTSLGNDIRRLLTIILNAMLRVRDAQSVVCPSNTDVTNHKKSKSPPYLRKLKITDIVESCSGQGDITLRQVRTALRALSPELQLLLVGMIALQQGCECPTVTAAQLYGWVSTQGTAATQLTELTNVTQFCNALHSLCDLSLLRSSGLRGNGSQMFMASLNKKGAAPGKGIMGTSGHHCRLHLSFDLRVLTTAMRHLMMGSGIPESVAGGEPVLRSAGSDFVVFRATEGYWGSKESKKGGRGL